LMCKDNKKIRQLQQFVIKKRVALWKLLLFCGRIVDF
jgi:hypothetical protein